MDNGILVLTANCKVTGGNPSLARSVADALIDNPPVPPNGFVLPGKLVLSGHSAGGLFVDCMGARMASRNFTALKGVLLLDDVDKDNVMEPNLRAVVEFGRPVLAILANASSCNSSNNALGPLRSLNNSFVGIKLTNNSKHGDAEGASTGGVFNWMCGSPKAHNIAYVQDFALHWAIDMLRGTHTAAYYPGGSKIQNLINSKDGVLIKELTTQECGNGIVENGEECDGGDCCDNNCYFTSTGTECRAADSECDLAETCTGSNASCSANTYEDDGEICSVGVCQNGECTSEDNIPPKADFTFSTSDLTVHFTDDSSDDDGTIVSYMWDFGDGETSSERNPSHTYSAESTYSVTLTITDSDDATDFVSKDVSFSKMQCGASPISGSSSGSAFNATSYRNALMPLLPAIIMLLLWGFFRRFDLNRYNEEKLL